MNQSTRSWSSHTSTRRCTAGRECRRAEGGKTRRRRVRGLTALYHQEAVGQHHQRQMTVQSRPASTLVVIQAALPFRVFVELLNRPTAMRQFYEAPKRRLLRQRTVVVGLVPGRSGQRTLAQEPSFASRLDTFVGGAQPRRPPAPMHPQRCELLAERLVGSLCSSLAPGDGLPGLLRQRTQQPLSRMERGGASSAPPAPGRADAFRPPPLLPLAAAPRSRCSWRPRKQASAPPAPPETWDCPRSRHR